MTKDQNQASAMTDAEAHAILQRMADYVEDWADSLDTEPTTEECSGEALRFIIRALATPAQQTEFPAVPEGWELVAVNEAFSDLMFWMERCDNKGHLDNCPDLIEPWERFEYNYIENPTPSVPSVAQQTEAPKDADAIRYQWLRERFAGYDFEWGEPAMVCAVFDVGQYFRGGRDISAAIDAAIAKEKAK